MDKIKVAPELILTAVLSGSITIIISVLNIILCIIALIWRYDCEAGSLAATSGSQYFMTTLYRVYIQDDACPGSPYRDDLTSAYSVFILVILTLCFAVVSFVAATALITAAVSEESYRYISVTAYVYVGTSIAVLIVDLTFATHFGMDHTTLKNELNSNSAGVPLNYETDMLRVSALLLMSIALKGYLFHILNIIFVICLMIYVVEHHKNLHRNEHAIHKLGALNAYDYSRSQEGTWPVRSDNMYVHQQPDHLSRNSHINRAFHDDDIPRHRENPLVEMQSRPERSDSWLRNPSNQGPGLANRPFSYLEEIRNHPNSLKNQEPKWRRDWPPPPVPAPDYSPPARRLKSAMKPVY